MEKRILGRTGIAVSELSLGAWQIGGVKYGAVSDAAADAVLQSYLDAGGNFIDTANRYDESEKRLGQFLKRNGGRERIVLASKTHQLAEGEIRKELEQSLRLMNTDYLDLYYLHAPPDDPDQMQLVLGVFETLKKEGKIRSIGASIKGPDVTSETVGLSEQYIETGSVDVLMLIYSILRQKNREVFELAGRKQVGIVARTVLESGFLSGKYAPGHRFTSKEDHRQRWSGETLDQFFESTRTLQKTVAGSPYRTLVELALRFALTVPEVSSVVVGARTTEQICQLIEASSAPVLPNELHKYLIEAYFGNDADFNIG